MYTYIDDVLCISNPDFEHYLGQIYPVVPKIKDTTESITTYIDSLSVTIDPEGWPSTTNEMITISSPQTFRS